LVVLHMTEGGYYGSVAWLCDPRANASAHLCMKADGSEVTQLVPLSMKAWAQVRFNGRALSLEIEGYTADGLADVALNAAAGIAAWLCLAYNIPPVWAERGEGRGVCCHHDLGAAGGGHHDICGIGDATWMRMMTAVQGAYADMARGPLPPFALDGAPDINHVEPPNAITPTPSHQGAWRNEVGDVHAHATPSGYPSRSVAALQWSLRSFGYTVEIDGGYGPLTQDAVRAFQISNGLVGDGLAGPVTWRSIDAAMARRVP
jgi:hypothetical protein